MSQQQWQPEPPRPGWIPSSSSGSALETFISCQDQTQKYHRDFGEFCKNMGVFNKYWGSCSREGRAESTGVSIKPQQWEQGWELTHASLPPLLLPCTHIPWGEFSRLGPPSLELSLTKKWDFEDPALHHSSSLLPCLLPGNWFKSQMFAQ